MSREHYEEIRGSGINYENVEKEFGILPGSLETFFNSDGNSALNLDVLNELAISLSIPVEEFVPINPCIVLNKMAGGFPLECCLIDLACKD